MSPSFWVICRKHFMTSREHFNTIPLIQDFPDGRLVENSNGDVEIFLTERENAAQAEVQNVPAKTARTEAVIIAFVAQTLPLFTVAIFLIFAGYLDMVSAFYQMAL